MIKRYLRCSCCGSDAGRWLQWSNMDTGYGICRKCVDWLVLRRLQELTLAQAEQRPARDLGMDHADVERTYGKAGVHYAEQ